MKINGKIAGDLEKLTVKPYKEAQTTIASFLYRVKVQEKEAKEVYGAELYRVAFGGMVKNEDKKTVSFPCESMTPKLVVETHVLKMFGHEFKANPEVKKITPHKNEPHVVMDIVVEMPCDKKHVKILKDIILNVGEVVEINCEPCQMSLPLGDGAKVIKRDGAFGNPKPQVLS